MMRWFVGKGPSGQTHLLYPHAKWPLVFSDRAVCHVEAVMAPVSFHEDGRPVVDCGNCNRRTDDAIAADLLGWMVGNDAIDKAAKKHG